MWNKHTFKSSSSSTNMKLLRLLLFVTMFLSAELRIDLFM